MENILLTATALGLGSIWIGVYGIAYIGYAAEEKQAKTNYNESRIYYEQYDPNRKHRAWPKNMKYTN